MANCATGILTLGFLVLVYSPIATVVAAGIGCSVVDKANPVFKTAGGNYDPASLTHEACIFACFQQSSTSFGIQAGQCLCSTDNYSPEPSTECGDPCPGDASQACGNDTHIAFSLDPIPALPLPVTVTDPSPTVIAGQSTVLTARGADPSNADIRLELDPGDGTLVSDLTSSPMTDHVYWGGGQFLVVATAWKYSLIFAHDAAQVTVAMTVAGISIQCPDAVEIEKWLICTVEVVQGTDVTLTMQVDGVDQDPLLMLGSATVTAFGVVGPNGTQTPATATTWVLPATESTQRTRLLSVEALVSEVGDGSFTFLILKPHCQTGTYCATDNTCKGDSSCKYDPATYSSPLVQRTCTVGSSYCLAGQRCTGSADCPAKPLRFQTDKNLPIDSGRPGYEVVASIPMVVSSIGLFRHDFDISLPELHLLEVGHVLGLSFTVIGAQIAVHVDAKPNQTEALEYKLAGSPPAQGAILELGNFQLDSARHLMRATGIVPLVTETHLMIPVMGDYEITASAGNDISSSPTVDSANVSVQIFIMGLELEALQPAVEPLQNASVTVTLANGSHVRYLVDWGDGSSVDTYYTYVSDSFNISHRYSVANDYMLNVTAVNLISSETQLLVILVQNPVVREQYLISAGDLHEVAGDGTPTQVVVTITLVNPNTDLVATDSIAAFKCLKESTCPQDSETDLSTQTTDGTSRTQSLSFTVNGTYTIRVNISNLVSFEIYEIKITLHERLSGVETFTQYLPSSSQSSVARFGHGAAKDTFLSDRPVEFNMKIASGSEVKYVVDFGDGSPLANFTHEESPFEHDFPIVGVYLVTIWGSNPVSEPIEITTTVKTLIPIRGVNLKDMGVSRVNETRHLNLSMDATGTDSCVLVDFGDGSQAEAYGNCINHPNWRGELNQTINLEHVYREQASFTVWANGSNTLSSDNGKLIIPVAEAKKPCGLPDISIQDTKPGWWLPRVIYRKDQLIFQGNTKLNCWFIDNTKTWTLEQLNPQTGDTLPAETSSLQQPTSTVSTLILAPYTLDIGLYRLSFQVTMNKTLTDNLDFTSVVSDYIDVQRSRLHVALIEGQMTAIVRGWGTMLHLKPGVLSKDPDVPPDQDDQGFEKIKYLCRRIGEEYSSTDFYVEIPEELDTNATDRGGCFGSGPGILNSTEPTLSWNTTLMLTDIQYELLVIITKDIRKGNFTLELELKPGDPPQITITVGQGTIYLPGNGAQIINPTGNVRLTASCTEFCEGIQYTWDMKGMNATGYKFKLPGWQVYTTGEAEYLYIKKALFSEFPDYPLFEIRAEAVNGKQGKGYSSMKIQLNEPPKEGTCTVSRDNITAGEPLEVTCEGWIDGEGIEWYKFFAKTLTFEAALINVKTSKTELKLPLGSKENDYLVSLEVTAEDVIGASTTVNFADVIVRPPVKERAANHSAVQAKLYETLIAEGNPAQINAQLLLDISLLLVTPTTSTESHPGDDEDIPTKSDEDISQEQQARAAKAEEIQRMAELQASVVMSSPEDIILVTSTMSLVSEDSKAMSPAALGTMSGMADNMISFVETDSSATKDETKLNQVGSGLITFVGNMFAGTAESVNNPIVTTSSTSTQAAIDEQEQMASESKAKAESTLAGLELVVERLYQVVVVGKLPGEYRTTFSTPNLELTIDRNKASKLANQTIQDGVGNVTMPEWCDLMDGEGNCSEDNIIDLKLQSTPRNSYTFASGIPPDRHDSGLVNFTLFGNNSEELNITGLSDDNLINIGFGKDDEIATKEFTVFDPTDGNSSFTHNFQVESVGETVVLELRTTNHSAVYGLFMSRSSNVSYEEYDFMFILPNATEEETMDPPLQSPWKPPSAADTPSHQTTAEPLSTDSMTTTDSPSTTADLSTTDKLPPTESLPFGLWKKWRDSLTATDSPSTTADLSTTDSLSTTGHLSTTDSASTTDTRSTLSSDNSVTNPGKSAQKEPVVHTLLFGADQHMGKIGQYRFKVAELAQNGTPQVNFTGNYSLRILQIQCAYYHFDSKTWLTDGVRMVLDKDTKRPICQTNHLTPFSSSWIVKPVPLDFDLVFSDLSFANNKTIYLTCAGIYTFFLFIFVWARRKDKKDLMMLGVTPLPDNNPRHNYLYEIVVLTGKRMNSGTSSKVSFVLSGEEDETPARSLEDPKRDILCRGGIDRFLLATPKSLGTLNYMRIWHDNSGQGTSQSWYMNYITVRDLQTKRRYFFISNEWFSLVDGDCQVDRLIPVAGKEQMQEFSHVFTSQTGKNFNDSHLWISIVTRPPGSRFTRMQRAMCCLMALWLEMLTSIMFYEAGSAAPPSSAFNIGPLSLSPSEIAIGIEANLIVFPVSLLMVQIFKKSRPWKKQEDSTKATTGQSTPSPVRAKDYNIETVSSRDVEIACRGSRVELVHADDLAANTPATDAPSAKTEPKKKSSKRKKTSLPWWCIYIAWVICILVTLTATAFTFFYGLYFKDQKTSSWLHSITISFFFGIVLTQPIKVIAVSLFISLVFKTPNAEEEMEDAEEEKADPKLQEDEEWMHALYGGSKVPATASGPLEPHVIEKQRTKRVKELKMYSILREILFSVIFVWILSIFSYGNQDPYAFWTKDAHVKLLVAGDGNHTFLKANSIPKFWQWVNTGLVPGMYAGPYYNGDEPSQDEQRFLGDRYSKILGTAKFRQLRVPKGKCDVNWAFKHIVSECNIGYSTTTQDEASYSRGWTPYDPSAPPTPQYNFTSYRELDSYPVWGRHSMYLGGGYVYDIDTTSLQSVEATMAKMYEEAWIDRYTRVLFIEFSVYNAQTNLFSFINLMVEILPTGGCYPHYRVDVMRLLTYHEGIGLIRVICEATFFVFVICLTIKELLLIRKEGKKYFKVFWNLNELAIIILSIATMVVYFFRLFVTNSMLNLFADKDSTKPINLQFVAYWNELMGYMLGCLVFLSTLKFLKLLRFNRRIGLLSSTIRGCSSELFNFTFMFSFVFVAFASAFYLIFCNRLINYSDMLFTIETMITAVLGKFKFGELLVTESILGPLFFFGFTGYVCFVMINMFLTIIIEAFKTVKTDINKQSNEYEMVDFILNRFKSATGLKRKKVQDDEDLPNLDMDEYEANVAKSLPDKVDQLMEKIALNYFDKGTFNDFIKEIDAQKKKKDDSKKSGRKIFIS